MKLSSVMRKLKRKRRVRRQEWPRRRPVPIDRIAPEDMLLPPLPVTHVPVQIDDEEFELHAPMKPGPVDIDY